MYAAITYWYFPNKKKLRISVFILSGEMVFLRMDFNPLWKFDFMEVTFIIRDIDIR